MQHLHLAFGPRALVIVCALGASACVVTTRESYDARYGSLMPAPQGPAIAGPMAGVGDSGLGLGLFSGFGGQTRGTVVGGASGNISAGAGGRLLWKRTVLEQLEVGGAFSIRPGSLGTSVASDTETADFRTDLAFGATFATRWWWPRGPLAAVGLVTELGVDLVPQRSRTVVTKVKTVDAGFGPTTTTTVDAERHFELTLYPKVRVGPIIQLTLGEWFALTGGAIAGNEIVVEGRRTAERGCTGVLHETCDGPRTSDSPSSHHTLSVVPFLSPSFRIDDRLTFHVQIHAVLGLPDVARPSPYGAEAGLILSL